MRDKIKQSIQQHFIIWWTVSCSTAALSGAICLVTKIKQKDENAFQYLGPWVRMWTLIACIGLFPGAIICLTNGNKASSDAEERENVNMDGQGNIDAVIICRKDGPGTGAQIV